MNRKWHKDRSFPIGGVFSRPGSMELAFQEASPQAMHHVTWVDPVDQLTGEYVTILKEWPPRSNLLECS